MTPVAPANCPQTCKITGNIPMAHVASVDRSSEFYALLGFESLSRFSGHDGVTNWSKLGSGDAKLMLARASGPIIASEQAVLFYMYSNNVAALREHLLKNGIPDAGTPDFEGKDSSTLPAFAPGVFTVVPRFFMPNGELRIHDPDGYVILVGQLEP